MTAHAAAHCGANERRGRPDLPRHTYSPLSLPLPPIISLMWPAPSVKKATGSLAIVSQMQIASPVLMEVNEN